MTTWTKKWWLFSWRDGWNYFILRTTPQNSMAQFCFSERGARDFNNWSWGVCHLFILLLQQIKFVHTDSSHLTWHTSKGQSHGEERYTVQSIGNTRDLYSWFKAVRDYLWTRPGDSSLWDRMWAEKDMVLGEYNSGLVVIIILAIVTFL